ncbi:MAG: GNAT family N-acetyltransferase [Candidatus Planktophila sp.]|jgi:ribosomal protein S18 acetylase RimI-like enzyme|nr:GNAT family N-acetyltransferase [Candidatus Planktophila sp.]
MTKATQGSASPLSGAIGKRVTIRLREADGGLRDIVGILQSEHELINSKSQSISFSKDDIAIWREIKPLPDRAGTGSPLSLRIIELEKLSDTTWPAAEIIEFGKWRLRISDGFTMRANSVLPTGAGPIGEPPLVLADAVEHVIKSYRDRGLTPTFTLPLPIYQELDEYLESQGWQIKVGVQFLIKDIDLIETEMFSQFNYEILDYPSEEWLGLQSDHRLENLMQRYPARYGLIKSGESVKAVGRIATLGTWAMATRLFVDPSHRGKGLAKQLMLLLMVAAKEDGATKIALQVDLENAAALALYDSMGFRLHHKYVYRVLETLEVR